MRIPHLIHEYRPQGYWEPIALDPLNQYSVHEAAHAVGYYVMGREFHSVDILPNGRRAGCVASTKDAAEAPEKHCRPDRKIVAIAAAIEYNPKAEAIAEVHREIACYLTGPVAHSFLIWRFAGWSSDLRSAVFASRFNQVTHEWRSTRVLLRCLLKRTAAFVGHDLVWQLILAFAKDLRLNRSLQQAQALELAGSACGTAGHFPRRIAGHLERRRAAGSERSGMRHKSCGSGPLLARPARVAPRLAVSFDLEKFIAFVSPGWALRRTQARKALELAIELEKEQPTTPPRRRPRRVQGRADKGWRPFKGSDRA